MKKRYIAALSIALGAGALCYGLAPLDPAKAEGAKGTAVSFKEDVLPIFQVHCAECHTPGGEGTKASGLDLTSYEGIMKGTKYGPMVVPGDAENSNLMWLLDCNCSPRPGERVAGAG